MGRGDPNTKPPPEEFRWKKGQSGNATGRPRIPADILEMRKITQIEFERIINKYFFMTDEEFEEDVARPEITKLEKAISRVLAKAITTSDEKTLEWLIARTLGKMREKLEVSSKSIQASITLTQGALPTIEQLALENPDLTQTQLESFSDKLQKLRDEIAASKRFAHELPSAVIDGEIVDGD